jgi:drug/metabolite transporter (DMT)-like permease
LPGGDDKNIEKTDTNSQFYSNFEPQNLMMQSNRLKWLLLIALALIWGSSFILIKHGLDGLTPMQLGSVRIICASCFLISIGFRSLPKIPLGKWKFMAITALCGTFLPAYLFAIAETRIGSTISSVLNALTPVAALVLGIAAFGLSLRRAQLIGVLVGLGGTMLLIFSGEASDVNQDYRYAGFVLIATICYGLNVNLIKKYLSDLNPLTISAGNSAIMILPAIIILASTGFFGTIDAEKVQHAVMLVMILGIMGTGIANLLFYRLIQMASPVFATSVTYLIPIVAFFWGMLDGEMLAPLQFVGALIILVGVYLSGKK